jgi:putative FmdB family regulatory protein
MPTYDYQCAACGHEFELFQQMSASVKKKCPECGKLKLKRLIGTGAGIIFKGGGFYETDYRSDSYKKEAAADGKSSSKTETGSEKKTSETGGSTKSDSSDSKTPAKKNASDTKNKPAKPKD